MPLWPVGCPVPQGGGAVIGLCHADVALGSALDSAEERWHPRPERSGGRQYARQLTGAFRPPRCLADITEEALAVVLGLRSESPMRSFDKFGVMGGVCQGAGRKKIPLQTERDFVVPFQDYGSDRSEKLVSVT